MFFALKNLLIYFGVQKDKTFKNMESCKKHNNYILKSVAIGLSQFVFLENGIS